MAYRPTERTEARRLAAREAIVRAARHAVARGGWREASMAAVAAEAGVATGSVYRHFPSKAELLCEVFRTASRREVDATAATAARAGTATERIALTVETFARRALQGRRLAWALIAEPVDPAVEAERLEFRRHYRDVFARVVRDGVATGELPPQDPEVSAAGLIGALAEALVGPLSPTATDRDEDELVAQIRSFCLRSISHEEPARVPA